MLFNTVMAGVVFAAEEYKLPEVTEVCEATPEPET